MRCATCGTENAPDSRFCGGCGAKQPGKLAPTAKILDDAAYPPTGQPQGPASIPPSSYGQGPASIPPPAMPTPAPGSMVRPPSQPVPGSIPPTNDPSRHISRPPDVSRHNTPPPSQPRPRVSVPEMSRAPAVSQAAQMSDDSIALPPRRPIGLIAIVLLLDLGLAAAGAVMLAKGLASDKPAAKPEAAPQKTEAQSPPAEPAPAAASAPSSAAAIADVAAPADPAPPAEAPAEKTAAADKSSASRRAKEKERAATTTTKPATVKTATSSSSPGPVTSPSGGSGATTHPQDPYADSAPAPKLTTEQEIDKLYAKSKGSFDRCAAGAVQGRVQVAFQVLADGRVANAAAVENSTGNAELGKCLVAAISGWTLSPHSGSALNFVRPFNYP